MQENAKVTRWSLCVLLFLATTLNYLDRQTLSVLAPQLQAELHLDNRQLGHLFSAFYWSYTAGHFVAGPLLDRFPVRWIYGGGVVAWSIAAALTSTAGGFAMLFAFRVLLGLMESGNWPGALRIISRVMPDNEKPLANGLFTSGTSVGALVAPALILTLAAWYGWRWAFALVGLLGLVWFAFWVPVSSKVDFGAPSGKGVPMAAAWKEIFALPQFWLVFVITSLMNPCLYYFVNWTPSFLAQSYGIRDRESLTAILTSVFLGLDLGYMLCGVWVLGLMKLGLSKAAGRRIVMGVATILLGASAVLASTPERTWMVVCLVICNFAVGTWISMYLTLAQEVSHRHLSTAAGLLGGAGSLFGALIMSWVGSVTQSMGNYVAPMLAVPAAAAVAWAAGWKAAGREP